MEMRKSFRLITSQGRISDRTPRAIAGARATSDLLAEALSLQAELIGLPDEACIDDWSASLPAAEKTLNKLRAAVLDAIGEGIAPLLAVNTCSGSLATLPAAVTAIPDLKILWIDAHGDFNTPETTGSGYLGGMVLAAVCGLWQSGHGADVDPTQIIIAGIRDIDEQERRLLEVAGVKLLPPSSTNAEAVLPLLGNSPVWIHVDWDSLEPGHVPAAYKVPNGLMPSQLRALFEAIPPEQIAGIEFAEFEIQDDEEERAQALALLSDVIEPLLVRRA